VLVSYSSTRGRLAGLLQIIERLERVAPYIIAAALFALPFLFPLGIGRDYPNHLAQVFIEHRLASEPLLAQNYVLQWFVVPHLAMDALAAPLAPWLSPYLVGSFFNGLTLVLLFSGALALNWRGAGGTRSAWPLLAVVPLFNEPLHWGFVDFLFACGLTLWTVYFWLQSEAWPRRRRLVLFSLAQIVLFFTHLLGFLLCGYLILTLELVRLWRDRGHPLGPRLMVLSVNMLQFALPMALFAFVLFGQEGVGEDSTIFGDWTYRFLNLFWSTSALDLQVSMLMLAAIGLLVYFVLRQGVGRVDQCLWPLVVAVLVLAFAMPVSVLGIWGLHFRYPFVGLLLLIAAIRLRPGAPGTRLAGAAAMLVAVGAVVAGAVEFHETDRRLQEIRRALALGEPGGALLVAAHYDPPDCRGCTPQAVDELHAGALAVIERQMFVPLLFTATSPVAASPRRHDLDTPSGYPLRRRQLVEALPRALPQRGPLHDRSHPYWHDWDRHFDNLLWLRDDGGNLDNLPGLERLASGEAFVFYRITGPQSGGGLGGLPPLAAGQQPRQYGPLPGRLRH